MTDFIATPDALRGDGKAWSGAFRQHSPALRAWFARHLRNASDIDDALQDVWVRIYGRSVPDDVVNIRAYLFQTAQNVIVDRSRRAKVRQQDSHEELQEYHHPVEDITADRVLMGKEALARMVSNVHSLPERTRDIFILHRFEGMGHAAIAQALGISVSAVEKHIMKALHKLMQAERDTDV